MTRRVSRFRRLAGLCLLAGCVWLSSLAQVRAGTPLDGLAPSWPGQKLSVTLEGAPQGRVESGAPLRLRITASQRCAFAVLLADRQGNARLALPAPGPDAQLQPGKARLFPLPGSAESLPADLPSGPAQVTVIAASRQVFMERKQLPDETAELVHADLADALKGGTQVAWQSLPLTVSEPLPQEMLQAAQIVDFFSRRGTFKGAQQSLLVHFDFGTDRLTGLGRRQLQQLAIALNAPAIRAMSFLLEGHTDDLGADAYNRRLSERRAQSARRYLLEQHVAARRLRASGVGKDDPVQDPGGDIARSRELSRRVVIRRIDALQ